MCSPLKNKTMKDQKPRSRRLDLLNCMPSGTQKYIAKIVGSSQSHVSAVLNGYRSQTSPLGINIIRLAERSAVDACRRARRIR